MHNPKVFVQLLLDYAFASCIFLAIRFIEDLKHLRNVEKVEMNKAKKEKEATHRDNHKRSL